MDIFVRIVSPILMIAIGLGGGIMVARYFRGAWGIYATGMVTFFLSQVFHLPFNAWVLDPAVSAAGWAVSPVGMNLVWIGLAYGLSAGVFEEVSRYLVYRFWRRDVRTWAQGLMFGAGHGGLEAIILGGIGLATAFQLLSLRGTDLSTVFPAEQLALAQLQVEVYWGASSGMILMGALERLSVVPIHIALAVLVLQAVKRRNLTWVGMAIGLHTLVNAVAVYGAQTWGIYPTEAMLVGFGMFAVFLAWRLKPEKEEGLIQELEEPEAPLRADQIALMQNNSLVDEENGLEDSRYADE